LGDGLHTFVDTLEVTEPLRTCYKLQASYDATYPRSHKFRKILGNLSYWPHMMPIIRELTGSVRSWFT